MDQEKQLYEFLGIADIYDELQAENEAMVPGLATESRCKHPYQTTGAHKLQSVSNALKHAVAVEQINLALRKDKAQITPLALKLANASIMLSAESAHIPLKAPMLKTNVSMESVDDKLDHLSARAQESFHHVSAIMADYLVMHAKDKIRIKQAIQKLKAQWGSLSERGKSDGLPKESIKNYGTLLNDGVFVREGATISKQIGDFLGDHTHLFERLIRYTSDWIATHADALNAGRVGIKDYCFVPQQYTCQGSSLLNEGSDDGMVTYRYSGLPGRACFDTTTVSDVCYGVDALYALSNSRAFMVSAGGVAVDNSVDMPSLDRDTWLMRMEETRLMIEALEKWAEFAYGQLWKDARFDEVLVRALTRDQVDVATARYLDELCVGTITQLHQASTDVGDYACGVCAAMLRYLTIA